MENFNQSVIKRKAEHLNLPPSCGIPQHLQDDLADWSKVPPNYPGIKTPVSVPQLNSSS